MLARYKTRARECGTSTSLQVFDYACVCPSMAYLQLQIQNTAVRKMETLPQLLQNIIKIAKIEQHSGCDGHAQ